MSSIFRIGSTYGAPQSTKSFNPIFFSVSPIRNFVNSNGPSPAGVPYPPPLELSHVFNSYNFITSAANKSITQGPYLPLNGGTMRGSIDMNAQLLTFSPNVTVGTNVANQFEISNGPIATNQINTTTNPSTVYPAYLAAFDDSVAAADVLDISYETSNTNTTATNSYTIRKLAPNLLSPHQYLSFKGNYHIDMGVAQDPPTVAIDASTGTMTLNQAEFVSSAGSVSIVGPAETTSTTAYFLPTDYPVANGYVLSSDTTGTLKWEPNGGGGGPYLPLAGGEITGDLLVDGMDQSQYQTHWSSSYLKNIDSYAANVNPSYFLLGTFNAPFFSAPYSTMTIKGSVQWATGTERNDCAVDFAIAANAQITRSIVFTKNQGAFVNGFDFQIWRDPATQFTYVYMVIYPIVGILVTYDLVVTGQVSNVVYPNVLVLNLPTLTNYTTGSFIDSATGPASIGYTLDVFTIILTAQMLFSNDIFQFGVAANNRVQLDTTTGTVSSNVVNTENVTLNNGGAGSTALVIDNAGTNTIQLTLPNSLPVTDGYVLSSTTAGVTSWAPNGGTGVYLPIGGGTITGSLIVNGDDTCRGLAQNLFDCHWSSSYLGVTNNYSANANPSWFLLGAVLTAPAGGPYCALQVNGTVEWSTATKTQTALVNFSIDNRHIVKGFFECDDYTQFQTGFDFDLRVDGGGNAWIYIKIYPLAGIKISYDLKVTGENTSASSTILNMPTITGYLVRSAVNSATGPATDTHSFYISNQTPILVSQNSLYLNRANPDTEIALDTTTGTVSCANAVVLQTTVINNDIIPISSNADFGGGIDSFNTRYKSSGTNTLDTNYHYFEHTDNITSFQKVNFGDGTNSKDYIIFDNGQNSGSENVTINTREAALGINTGTGLTSTNVYPFDISTTGATGYSAENFKIGYHPQTAQIDSYYQLEHWVAGALTNYIRFNGTAGSYNDKISFGRTTFNPTIVFETSTGRLLNTTTQTKHLLLEGTTSGILTLNPAAATTSYTVVLPSAQGAANTVLLNDGSGNLSWSLMNYSNGTWTFGITTGTALFTGFGTNSNFKYNVLNKMVNVEFYCDNITFTGAPAGAVTLIGLPFASATYSNWYGQALLTYGATTKLYTVSLNATAAGVTSFNLIDPLTSIAIDGSVFAQNMTIKGNLSYTAN